MANPKRYRELKQILNQLELALAISREEIDDLEQEALGDGVIFVRDSCGGWETSQLTQQEQAVLQTMDEGDALFIVTVGEEALQAVLDQIAKECTERATMMKWDLPQ